MMDFLTPSSAKLDGLVVSGAWLELHECRGFDGAVVRALAF